VVSLLLDKYGNTIRIIIIINTATDTEDIIRNFKKFYDNNLSMDILISSMRDDILGLVKNSSQ